VPNNSLINALEQYDAILNSTLVNTLTLDKTSSPASVTIRNLSVQNGNLNVGTGSTLAVNNSVTVAHLGVLQMSGGTLSTGGLLSNNNGEITGYGTISGAGALTNSAIGAIIADGGTLDLSGKTITNLSGGTLTGGQWGAGNVSGGTLKLPDNITSNSGFIFLQNAGSQITNASDTSALAGFNANQGGGLDLEHGGTFTTGGSFTNNNNSFLTTDFGGSLTIAGDLTNSNNSTVVSGVNSGANSITVMGNLSNDATSSVAARNGILTLDESSAPTGSTIAATNAGNINLGQGIGGTLNLQDSNHGNTVSFAGGGTINLGFGSSITSPTTDMTLTNVDNTITGAGSISNLHVINNGTITPVGFDGITISPNSLGFTNDGAVTLNLGDRLSVNGSGPNGSTAIGVFQNGGLLTVNGGQFLDQSSVTVGFSPGITGTANVSGGEVSDTTLTLGHLAGSTGNVTISGPGSLWGNSFVNVGESGTGNLTITSGGLLSSGGGVIAANPGSSGTVLVTGTGSEFFSRGLVVQSGGSVTATSGGRINSGGTTLSNFGNVTVGSGGSLDTGNSEA
jgi:T5SS/PEP-CTERM-associated repeat protein